MEAGNEYAILRSGGDQRARTRGVEGRGGGAPSGSSTLSDSRRDGEVKGEEDGDVKARSGVGGEGGGATRGVRSSSEWRRRRSREEEPVRVLGEEGGEEMSGMGGGRWATWWSTSSVEKG